jgi:hypothetical protein
MPVKSLHPFVDQTKVHSCKIVTASVVKKIQKRIRGAAGRDC